MIKEVTILNEMGFSEWHESYDAKSAFLTDGDLHLYLNGHVDSVRIAKKHGFDKWGNSSFIDQNIPHSQKQWEKLIGHAKAHVKCHTCWSMLLPSDGYTFRKNVVYCNWCGKHHKDRKLEKR